TLQRGESRRERRRRRWSGGRLPPRRPASGGETVRWRSRLDHFPRRSARTGIVRNHRAVLHFAIDQRTLGGIAQDARSAWRRGANSIPSRHAPDVQDHIGTTVTLQKSCRFLRKRPALVWHGPGELISETVRDR